MCLTQTLLKRVVTFCSRDVKRAVLRKCHKKGIKSGKGGWTYHNLRRVCCRKEWPFGKMFTRRNSTPSSEAKHTHTTHVKAGHTFFFILTILFRISREWLPLRKVEKSSKTRKQADLGFFVFSTSGWARMCELWRYFNPAMAERRWRTLPLQRLWTVSQDEWSQSSSHKT